MAMNYLLWVPVGALGGAALGIIGPVGMYMLIVVAEGDRAQGAGTPFAILLIVTVPGGAMLGAYAGAHRAATGVWRGVFSATQGPREPRVERYRATRKSPTLFRRQLAQLGEEEAIRVKQDYLQDLQDELEDTKLNYRLVVVAALVGLAIPLLLIWPLCLVASHLWFRRSLTVEMAEVRAIDPRGNLSSNDR
jgi:hypothetical protein